MQFLAFNSHALPARANFSTKDIERIHKCRQNHTRLGFAYQLIFVRLYNRFPAQAPFEISQEVLTHSSVQLDIPVVAIDEYKDQRKTIINHQFELREYLSVRRFGEAELDQLEAFIFAEACRLEQTGPLLNQAKKFLIENLILLPGEVILHRAVIKQRQMARDYIYQHLSEHYLPEAVKSNLDNLLETQDEHFTKLHTLKLPPGRPSPAAILRLTQKLELLQGTQILEVDLSWLNNNYQRSLARYARQRSAGRLKQLKSDRRYAVLTCFLRQLHGDTIDFIIEMHDKLITSLYNRAENNLTTQMGRRRKAINHSLATFRALGTLILDESIENTELRELIFQRINKETLKFQLSEIDIWLSDKNSHVFHQVSSRFSYLRQFAPALLKSIELESDSTAQSPVVKAVSLLNQMNKDGSRKLPEDAPLGFIPKKIRNLIETDGVISKRDWEVALLTAVRDEIRTGNVAAKSSKRFGRFDNFFISQNQWEKERSNFFIRCGLPENSDDVPTYLTDRLNRAYDTFLDGLPHNTYASVDENGWILSVDSAEKLDKKTEAELASLKDWLSEHLRSIKLPELLIEVDNDLHFTRPFLPSVHQKEREPDSICHILATIVAFGCNIGPFTMAQLTEGVTYNQIKRVYDWQLSEEAQRQSLATIVNAISSLDVTRHWGQGRTSSSDGQRFAYKQRVLQQTWSPRYRDYALEFYSFVADNYAPFYSVPIECTDRDAAYVLDGLLYNESDLALEEHFTDTHGYTEINFAAFAMLGRQFSPRIRGIQKQRIYRLDDDKDYGALAPLLKPKDRRARLDWITPEWDRMGQFYASLENGHMTASTALKRLVGFSGKNNFYRANREFGRVFKTEHILRMMSDPVARKQVRRGLLKSEEMHALGRQVFYGKQGKVTARDFQAQKNTSNCLTIAMASIIYWQAKEISRVIHECDPEGSNINLSLLEHISPIGWENVILYGEYVLDRSLVRQ